MDRVHEGVHGPGPQWWSMDLGSMSCMRPKFYSFQAAYSQSRPQSPRVFWKDTWALGTRLAYSVGNQASLSLIFLIVNFFQVLSFILDTESLIGIMGNDHISFKSRTPITRGARGFSCAVSGVGLRSPKQSEEFPSAASEKKTSGTQGKPQCLD